MARETARLTGCDAAHVLVSSTGVIGVSLDAARVRKGIDLAFAALSPGGGHDAARGIMTTDVSPKESACVVTTARGAFTVGGMAKGAGMIEPMMATMLGFVTTDASVAPPVLQRALREAVDVTFNAITVDGECSTNDCVFALANGASGVEINENLYPTLVAGFRAVAHELALGIVRGGEGATKLVAITVTGAASDADAWMAARAIANSPLVKTAIHGGDPNWGRLVAAAGRSGAAFVLDGARVQIGSLVLFENGRPFAAYLTGTNLAIEVNLGAGGAFSATMWTCDFSADYVKINAEYRT
jgi:glutamate N-acetyltransferase/amino-acid N-acetyltransferase